MTCQTRLALLLALCFNCGPTRAQETSSIYAANCANCHGLDGSGNTVLGRALKLRDLRSPEVQKLSQNELVMIIGKGAARGKMPGFEKRLGTATISNLAAYLHEIEAHPALPQRAKAASDESGDAQSVFAARCSHCHAADGSGNTMLGRTLKLLDMRSESQKLSDNQIIKIIARGTDRGKMPGFQKKLGPDMVEQLASYVRQLSQAPISAAKAEKSSEPPQAEPLRADGAAAQPGVVSLPVVLAKEQNQPETPQSGDQPVETPTSAKSPPAVPSAGRTGSRHAFVDLNSATKEELMALPGITEADAERIIAGRPYKSSLQFKIKNVIAPEKYAKIAAQVVAKQSKRTTNKGSQ